MVITPNTHLQANMRINHRGKSLICCYFISVMSHSYSQNITLVACRILRSVPDYPTGLQVSSTTGYPTVVLVYIFLLNQSGGHSGNTLASHL